MTDLHIPPASSMPTPTEPDPRTPRLAESGSFVRYMGQGWSEPDRTPPVIPGAAEAAGRHRQQLKAEYGEATIVLGAGHAPVRSNDTNYDFRPDSNFYWLTGCAIEDAVLVIRPSAQGGEAVLYAPPPAFPGDRDFFADAAHGELWVGPAPSLADWSEALGLTVKPLTELQSDLKHLASPLCVGNIPAFISVDFDAARSTLLVRHLSELRMVKDAWEIQQLREAITHTVDGFRAVIREIPAAVSGLGERWLQGTFDRHARTFGNGAGYATIVGSGEHAPTLHWVRCDGPVLEDKMLLLDMGVETKSFYTADVTRTFPASGTYTNEQRLVHDLVEKAHRAGLAAVSPGKIFSDFHTSIMEVIAEGLHDWGLLRVSVDEALSPSGQQHRRYLVCGVGHHLGLDVHDCAQSSYSAYQDGLLLPGMVLTVEPGLYFHANDLTVPPELRGIGVRIEDDILLTETGSEVLSAELPLDASGLELWMRDQT